MHPIKTVNSKNMKKLIIFFFLICVKSTFAQVVPDSIDLRSNSYSAVFENNASAINKVQIAKKWFALNFQNYRDILITEDLRAGKIVLKPSVLYKADEYSKCYITAVVTFECDKNSYSIKFDDVRKQASFATIGNLETADTVYKQCVFTTEVETRKFHRYHELKAKSSLDDDERRELKLYTHFENYTEESLRKENMQYYTELQNIVAEIINKLKLTLDEYKQ